jgi:hypothetical protein
MIPCAQGLHIVDPELYRYVTALEREFMTPTLLPNESRLMTIPRVLRILGENE